MQVTQLTSSDYSNGARGFAGAPDVQNFSNKILILIDGRSVYSPLFSGIAYDMQDVLMDDIDRIEVISGPGATLWGANAMNGVINIITRKASDTHGTLRAARMRGAEEQAAALRYGGEHGRGRRASACTPSGSIAAPPNSPTATAPRTTGTSVQAGFRLDGGARPEPLHGAGRLPDAPSRASPACPTCGFNGANVLGRWEHAGDRVDHARADVLRPRRSRAAAERPGIRHRHLRLRFAAERECRRAHQLVWGLGRRYNDYQTVNNDLAFVPDHRTLELTNVFVQDSITLSEELKLTAGIKFEDNSYSDWSVLPDLRLSWAPNDKNLFWLAGSRAIRAPTPFDTDVQEFVGGQLFVLGDPDFKPEKVTAYELGYRGNPRCARFVFRQRVLQRVRRPAHRRDHAGGVPAAALGQSHGRQRVRLRSVGQHPAHAVVAPVAGRSHAAQAPRVQRRRLAARGRAPGGQRSLVALLLKSSMDLRRFTIDVIVRKVGRAARARARRLHRAEGAFRLARERTVRGRRQGLQST